MAQAQATLAPAQAPRSVIRPLAGWLQANHMSHLGIRNTMRLARVYNWVQYRRHDHWRRTAYRERFNELLQENGAPMRPRIELKDGFAIDTSGSLPHLDRILEDGEKIAAQRCGDRIVTDPYRSYFQDVWKAEDAWNYPSFLDFGTSSDVLRTVADYLKCVPALSVTLPQGIRVVESNAKFDKAPDHWKDSQLYHIDYYSLPNVYVIVLLRDATSESGPFTFLPRSVSQKAAEALGYWKRRRGYRVTDEEIYSVIDRKEVIEFAYPRGTVLFIESSGCFHYGSRNAVNPRFQVMYGYTGACRTDFSEAILPHCIYPVYPTDSRLRRMVLTRDMLEA